MAENQRASHVAALPSLASTRSMARRMPPSAARHTGSRKGNVTSESKRGRWQGPRASAGAQHGLGTALERLPLPLERLPLPWERLPPCGCPRMAGAGAAQPRPCRHRVPISIDTKITLVRIPLRFCAARIRRRVVNIMRDPHQAKKVKSPSRNGMRINWIAAQPRGRRGRRARRLDRAREGPRTTRRLAEIDGRSNTAVLTAPGSHKRRAAARAANRHRGTSRSVAPSTTGSPERPRRGLERQAERSSAKGTKRRSRGSPAPARRGGGARCFPSARAGRDGARSGAARAEQTGIEQPRRRRRAARRDAVLTGWALSIDRGGWQGRRCASLPAPPA